MRQKDIIAGLVYSAKVSGRLSSLEVLQIQTRWTDKQNRVFYHCRNLNTKREIIVKSANRFHARVTPKETI